MSYATLHMQPDQNRSLPRPPASPQHCKQGTSPIWENSRLRNGNSEIPYLSFLPPPPLCTFDVERAVANLVNNELWIKMFSLASIANMVLIICEASSFEPVHQQGV